MSVPNKKILNWNRRNFLLKTLAGIALFPFAKTASLLAKTCPSAAPKAEAIKKRLLDPAGKTAKRLAYVVNAPDGKGHKKWKEGDDCGNCKFYKAHKTEPDYGRCSMAANRYVPVCGWCKSYLRNKKAKS